MRRRHGFTLLELVISCSVLIGLFSTLTLMLTRAHRLRAESEAEARALTEGRALLDRLAIEIRHTAGTNLTSLVGLPADEVDFSFVRVKDHPRGTEAGEAWTNIPFERVTYSFDVLDGNSTGGFHKANATWTPSTESAGQTNYATEYRFTRKNGESFVVTNVHSATDKITLPGGMKGDTVTLPITSGSSKRIYDTVNGTSVHVDIVATESPLTNRVVANVTFTNAFSSVVSNSIRRTPGIAWPEPQARHLRFERRLDLAAETRTNEYGLLPLVLVYTNAISSRTETNRLAVVYTNAPALSPTNPPPAGVATNGTSGVATNLPPAVLLPSTNVVARTIWSLTNLFSSATYGTNTLYPRGAATFLPMAPIHRTNLWRIAMSPATTNATADVSPAEAADDRPDAPPVRDEDPAQGRTNRLDGTGISIGAGGFPDLVVSNSFAGNGGNGPAMTSMDGQELRIVSDDFFAVPRPLAPPPVATNLLRDLVPPMVFDNSFTARSSADGPSLPLVLYRKEHVRSPLDMDAFLHETIGYATAIGLANGNDLSIVKSLHVSRRQRTALSGESIATGPVTNFTTICSNRFESVASFLLQMDIPATLAKTNRYEYLQDTSDRIWTGTSQSEDTTWETVVLDEDLDPGELDVIGLWLEEARRDGSEWVVEKRELTRETAPAPVETTEEDRFDAATATVAKLRFTPLSFRKDGDDLALVEWDPADEEAEPPVCVDIHLELLAPLHKKRAASIPDETKREDYVERHLLRLDRRVPLHDRNLWRPPR